MDKAKEFNGAFDPQLFFDQLNGKVKMGEVARKDIAPRKSLFANNPRGQFLKATIDLIVAGGLGWGAYELNQRGIVTAGMPEDVDGGSVPLTTATDVATATNTAEPMATATPTEVPLPEGPISELQKTLGNEFRLTQDGDHFAIPGVENLKIFAGGWAEFTIGSEVFTVSNRVVSAKDGVFTAGGWENKDGTWSIFGSGAPSPDSTPEQLAEWEAGLANFVMDEGASPEVQQAMSDTIHRYVALVTEKIAASEFDNVFVDGEKVDIGVPIGWQSYTFTEGGMEKTFIDGPLSEVIALGQGYARLVVYDVEGKQKLDLKIIPLITMDSDGSIFSKVGVFDNSYFSKMLDFLTKEKRTNMMPFLVGTASDKDAMEYFATESLKKFLAVNNRELLAKNVIKPKMDKLPQEELSAMGFWIFELYD